MGKRGTIKDAAAWILLYGISGLAELLALRAAVLLGSKPPTLTHFRKVVWNDYKSSGKLLASIKHHLGKPLF
jgi:hypothetical protein